MDVLSNVLDRDQTHLNVRDKWERVRIIENALDGLKQEVEREEQRVDRVLLAFNDAVVSLNAEIVTLASRLGRE